MPSRGASVRAAADADMPAAARLLHAFNREFSEPTPPAETLAEHLRELTRAGDTVVLLAGEDPIGIAVLRLRSAIWNEGLECHLAELYVVPEQRGLGAGRALMEAAIDEARRRGAETMDIGVDEPDQAARGLYESMGFTNRVGGPAGSLMFVYERDL
jgi:ribosomal protein S18 acetylase RimI-like enzyme